MILDTEQIIVPCGVVFGVAIFIHRQYTTRRFGVIWDVRGMYVRWLG